MRACTHARTHTHCDPQEVLCAVLPLREENAMKAYLLEGSARRSLLASVGGTVAPMAGALRLEGVLQVPRSSPRVQSASAVCRHIAGY